jgi:hypothetical protein
LFRGGAAPSSILPPLTKTSLPLFVSIHRVTECGNVYRRRWIGVTTCNGQERTGGREREKEREPWVSFCLYPGLLKLTGGGDDVKGVRRDGASRAHLPLVLLLLSHCREFVLKEDEKKMRERERVVRWKDS